MLKIFCSIDSPNKKRCQHGAVGDGEGHAAPKLFVRIKDHPTQMTSSQERLVDSG